MRPDVEERIDPPERAVDLARAAWRVVQTTDLGILAAAVAYYGFVSVVPLAAILLAVGTAIGGDALAAAVVDALGEVLTPGGQAAVEDALESGAGRVELSLAGLGVLAWGSIKVFRALDTGFSRVHGSSTGGGFIKRSAKATGALVATAVGTGAMVIAGALVAGVTGVAFVGALAPVALFAALLVVFTPLYLWFPDRPMTPRTALPGAAIAAGGWTVLITGYGLYAHVAPDYDLYGVLGAALLLVTWFYLAAWILLAGAAVNAVFRGDAPAPAADGSAGSSVDSATDSSAESSAGAAPSSSPEGAANRGQPPGRTGNYNTEAGEHQAENER